MSTDNKSLAEIDYEDNGWKPLSRVEDDDVVNRNPRNARDVVRRGGVNVANNVATVDDVDASVKPKVYGGYDDIIDSLEKRRKELGDGLPTKEQLARERRRQRTRALIGGIADGASAIANLFFTTKGAPNMYDGSRNMSDRMRQRYEKWKSDYEGRRKEYDDLGLRIAQLRQKGDELKYQRGRDAQKDALQEFEVELKQHKDAREEAKNKAYVEYMQARANGESESAALTKYQAALAAIDLEYREAYNKSVIDKNNRTGTGGSGGRTGGSGGRKGGSGGSKDYTQTVTKKGKDKYGNDTSTTTTTTRTYGNNKKSDKKSTGVNWK